MRRGAQALALAYLVVFAALIATAAAITFLGNPQVGEAVAQLDLAPKRVAHRAPAATPAGSPAATLPGQTAGTTPPVDEAAAAPETAGRSLVADPALIESTPEGPLPKIGDDGTMPMRAYAAPTVSNGKPRIAIVINGLGISAKATQAALAGLPADVTLGFAPYAADVQQWVTQARAKGHEVLLEVPMEPYDFPDSDPGQYTLRAGIGEDSNTHRLVWALTRMTGYVGVTNLLGGRLLSDAGALEPVLTYLTRRGLLFYDNGSALHSVAPDVSSRVGTYFAQATTTIDTIQSAMEIDHQLSDLETEARAKGSASGSGFIYPVTIDRVNVWAKGLAGRGFVLVPVSAIVSQTKQ
ncbi:MAG: divergent polysaccharide deacetylase family protein [Alphaproteobacteria bacterium]|nr:divergent polysaccharide deacetylase family protein [Alphaproteobacteria bacterium]MDE2266055.1 divergent polysaccharide deacetylase family protein [Alphaproteobacteria bacterium]MDE2499919.1 divergent polysaccharide deacetylase family protein [Alphaproteobacteria bacterium]